MKLAIGILLWAAAACTESGAAAKNATLAGKEPAAGDSVVRLALSLERAGALDSARRTYERAATLLPIIRDWLTLRAAAVTQDAGTRDHYYARIRGNVVRSRIPWTEAQSKERFLDLAGALRAYDALGAQVGVLRVRFAMATDSAARNAVRQELVSFLANGAADADARGVIAVLDRASLALSPSEELTVARAASRAGAASRGVAAYERALGAGLGNAQDHFDYATLLSRLGRDAAAGKEFGLVRAGPLVARAAYERARSMSRSGQTDVARAALDDVARRFASDSDVAPLSLLLRADIAVDDGQDDLARRLFRSVAARYPRVSLAPRALFRAAMISFIRNAGRTAALEFDSLAARDGQSDDGVAATYWAGRAWARAGDSTAARKRWRDAAARESATYYSVLAARQLKIASWTPPAAPESKKEVGGRGSEVGDLEAGRSKPFPAFDSLQVFAERAAVLDRVGLDAESRFELEHLTAGADSSLDRALATAAALRDHGVPALAIPLARKALDGGAARDAWSYRLLYPLVWADILRAKARAAGLEPSLVAALIRQESRFDARATSSAGAMGLMQVLPGVGGTLAAGNIRPWSPARLYEPEVNIALGIAHLAGLVRKHGDLARALAAYNAGDARVARWSKRAGAGDPEVFVERIPFAETRDYVRVIERDRAMYGVLYPDWAR